MNITSMLNAMIGTSTDFTANMMSVSGDDFTTSFNDVLGMTAASYADSSEGVVDETGGLNLIEEDKASFSELTTELAEEIADADDSVIAAAVKLLQSVGKAVEKLYGTGSESLYDDDSDETDSVVKVFTVMIKMITVDSDEENSDEETVSLDSVLAGLSDAIKAGLDEEKDTSEILEELEKALGSDDSALADAVMTVLCAMSGIDTSAEDFDLSSAEITDDALAKLGTASDILSKEISPYEKAELVVGIIKNESDSVVKFADYISNSRKSEFPEIEKDMGIMSSRSLSGNSRVNDASSQFEEIKPVKQDDSSEDNGLNNLFANDFRFRQLQGSDETAFTEETQTVYKELGEFVEIQVTEKISEAVSEGGVQELTVVLKPESLGEIAVKLVSDESGAVSVVLAASNPEVGKALSINASALAEELSKQNVEVSDVNVVNPSEASSYMGLDFTNQGFNRKNDGGDASQSDSGGSGRNVGAINSDINAADEVRAQRLLKEAKLWLTA